MKLPYVKIEVRDEDGNSVTLSMSGTKARVKMGGDPSVYHVNICGMAANQIRHQWVELFENPAKEEEKGGAQ